MIIQLPKAPQVAALVLEFLIFLVQTG